MIIIVVKYTYKTKSQLLLFHHYPHTDYIFPITEQLESTMPCSTSIGLPHDYIHPKITTTDHPIGLISFARDHSVFN